MARRAVVHIGTFKTGSTSIQAFLCENAQRLMAQGVYFPTSLGSPNHHGLAIYSLSHRETTGLIRYYGLQDREKREARRVEVREALIAELSSLPHSVSTVVFSNEHLSGLNTTSEVEQLKDLLAPHFDKIEIVVYLRRQDLRIISDYTQKVRDGYSKRLDLQNYKPSEGLDLLSFLDKWADVFGAGSIKPRIFSRSDFINGDLIDDFIAAAGIAADETFQRPAIENAGLSHEAIHFLRVFNEFVPHYIDGHRNPLRQRLLPYFAELFPGDGLRVAKSDVEKLIESVDSSNAAAGEKYFGRKEVFSRDFSRYADEPAPDPTFDEAVRIAAALWNKQAEHVEQLRNQLAALHVLVIANSERTKSMVERILSSDDDRKAYFPTLLEVFSALHEELNETRRQLELERGKNSTPDRRPLG